VFQVELLGPGESAVGGPLYQFGNPSTITGTTTWSEEQKAAVTRSLAVLNDSLVNPAGRPIRVAMAWRDDLPETTNGNSLSTALIDLAVGRGATTAEAAWRAGDAADPFPEAADILLRFNSEKSWHYASGLPGRQHDLQSSLTHEIVHGLGIASAYLSEDGFLVLSRWDELIEDSSGNRPQAGTFGAPEPLPLIGPEGTLRWRGEYANATYGGQMPIFTDEEVYRPGSTLHHPAPMGELMSWGHYTSEDYRAPNKLLLDVFRDLGWEINMDFYNAFGPTYYRDLATIENGADFLSDYDYTYALYVNGDGNHIVQSGALEARGDFADTLRLAGNDNRLEIAGSLTARGDDATALYVVGEGNLIRVGGPLQSQGDGSVGVYVAGGGNDLILSGATIRADTAVHFTYSNSLYIQGDSRIEGDMIAEGPRSVMGFGYLVDEAGQVSGYDPTFSFRFDDDIVGNWLGYLGAGELSLNGEADFIALAIRAQGTLKGSATIYGDLVNRGTVAPGNSIGTLTIDGDYTHEAGAVLEMEAGRGASDLLRVSGSADIQGGTLALVPFGYLSAGSYTFLEAGTLQGAFTELQSPAVFAAELDDSITNVLILDVTRNSYVSLSTSHNRGLSTVLDTERPTAEGDFATLLDSLDLALSRDALNDALATLSPRIHGAASMLVMNDAQARLSDLRHHLHRDAEGESRGMTGWLKILGQDGSYRRDGAYDEMQSDLYGLLLGVEHKGSRWTLGATLAVAENRYQVRHSGDDGESDSQQAYLYAAWCDPRLSGGWHLNAVAGGGLVQLEADRSIPFAGRQTESDHDGTLYGASVSGGYRVDLGNWVLDPTAGLSFVHLREESFREKGADSADLNIGNRDNDSLQSLMGFRLSHPVQLTGVRLVPELQAEWRHEFDRRTEDLSATLAGGGDRFDTPGRDLASDRLLLGLSLGAWMGKNLYAGLGYDCEVQSSGGATSHALNLEIAATF
jgi:outer membrane autotransporter protein